MSERKYPLTLTILGTFGFAVLLYFEKVNVANFSKLVDVSINISGILLGFLITLHGILISIRGNKIMRVLHQAGSLRNLNTFLKAAITSSSCLLIFCLVVLIFNFNEIFVSVYTPDILFLTWIMLVLFMSTTSYRFISLFISIISEDAKD